MGYPATIREWLTYLRKGRDSSSDVNKLIAGLYGIYDRSVAVQTAIAAVSNLANPRIALSYEEVKATADLVSTLISGDVLPPTLSSTLWEERVALALTLRALQQDLFALRFINGIFISRKVLPAEEQQRVIGGVRNYTVRGGDTLASIAAAELGSRDRWRDLQALNDLDYPYIVASSADYSGLNVLEPGDTLLVPAAPVTVQVPQAKPDPSKLFGVDIDVNAHLGQPSFEAGDLKLVAGTDNVQQAVRNRITTVRGELPLHADYGSLIHRWLGLEGEQIVAQAAALDLMRTVLEDPRVMRLDRTTAQIDTVTLTLKVEAYLIGEERPLQLNLIVPTVGGEAA